jgi:hypothetical protein
MKHYTKSLVTSLGARKRGLLGLFLSLVVMAGVLTPRAIGQETTPSCTAATLKGTYGLVGSGTAPGVGPVTVVGNITANGKGDLTYNAVQNRNGTVTFFATTGTYTIGDNCSGSIGFKNGEVYDFVAVKGGTQIDLASSSPNLIETIIANKL